MGGMGGMGGMGQMGGIGQMGLPLDELFVTAAWLSLASPPVFVWEGISLPPVALPYNLPPPASSSSKNLSAGIRFCNSPPSFVKHREAL